MTRAMREAGYLITGTEAAIGDHLAGCGVDLLTGNADLCRSEAGGLGFLFQVPDLALPIGGRCAEDDAPANVALVSFDFAAAVHDDHIAWFEMLRLDASMRIGRSFSEIS